MAENALFFSNAYPGSSIIAAKEQQFAALEQKIAVNMGIIAVGSCNFAKKLAGL